MECGGLRPCTPFPWIHWEFQPASRTEGLLEMPGTQSKQSLSVQPGPLLRSLPGGRELRPQPGAPCILPHSSKRRLGGQRGQTLSALSSSSQAHSKLELPSPAFPFVSFPDTAHPNLSISEGQKKCIHEPQPQKVPPTPERFDSTVCVLGLEGFSSGKHYWEVDVRSSTDWDLGVARKAIERKGKLSLSPKYGFWALGWSGRDYWAKTDPWTRVMVKKKPQKIGIYLSYQERREVTFFNVTDMSVLFTFNDCSFSGEVYPFFKNSQKETAMRICSLREDERV
uniref:B30.2/SPRY domain-containing protein n=1 Tax=Chelydra serpentina TaxID=8475 RepID=A0A8C3SHR8_CHESE